MIKLTEQEFLASSNEYMGKCLKCGADAYEVEPDARKYRCDECGERAVYGIEELLIMGRIEIVEEIVT